MNSKNSWQADVLQDLVTLLQPDKDVLALLLFGSYLKPETQFDFWSDVDVLLVVRRAALARFYPAIDWLKPLGRVYTHNQSSNEFMGTTRVCFDDFRRIDFVITTEVQLKEVETWPHLPFYQGTKPIFSRSNTVDNIAIQTYKQPELIPISTEQFQAMANQFWFKGMLAVYKVVRNDLLIALHLALDLIRDCCVLEMMLRDRAAGTNHHREGGIGNQFVGRLQGTQHPFTASGILDIVEQSSVEFDNLALQWSDSYQENRHPLLSWINHARESLDSFKSVF